MLSYEIKTLEITDTSITFKIIIKIINNWQIIIN